MNESEFEWEYKCEEYIRKVFVRSNLKNAFIGCISGDLVTLPPSKSPESRIESGSEIASIEIIESPIMVMGVGQNLHVYNINTREHRQLMGFGSRISCIYWDKELKRLYIGLWCNVLGNANIFSYQLSDKEDTLNEFETFRPDAFSRLWENSTGDIVRSIYPVKASDDVRYVAVGSENGELILYNENGAEAHREKMGNRITRLRVFEHSQAICILVLTDAASLELLYLGKEGISVRREIDLDSRAKEVFIYTAGSTNPSIVVTTNAAVYVLKVNQEISKWTSDITNTLINAIYWWPEKDNDNFLVKRRDNKLACYSSKRSNITRILYSIIQNEQNRFVPESYHTSFTKERAYSMVWVPEEKCIYYVTGDGHLWRSDIICGILGKFRFKDHSKLHSVDNDRLRSLSIYGGKLYFGGESGKLYSYKLSDHTVYETSQFQSNRLIHDSWIYEQLIVSDEQGAAILVIASQGVFLFDRELTSIADPGHPSQDNSHPSTSEMVRLRCGCWDQESGNVYVGSEEGKVYRYGVIAPTEKGAFEWIDGNQEVVYEAGDKVRCMDMIEVNGERLLIFGSEDGHVRAYLPHWEHSKPKFEFRWDYYFEGWVRKMAQIELNGKEVLAVAGRKMSIAFIDCESGTLICEEPIQFEPRALTGFSLKRETGIVVSGIDSNVSLYNVRLKKGKIIVQMPSWKVPSSLKLSFLKGKAAKISIISAVFFAVFIFSLLSAKSTNIVTFTSLAGVIVGLLSNSVKLVKELIK